MMREDPIALMKLIGGMYKIFEFDPTNAKDYTEEGAELYNEIHSEFVKKGFEKLPRGMVGLDGG